MSGVLGVILALGAGAPGALAAAGPSLGIQPVEGAAFELSWATSGAFYQLEESPSVGPGAAWRYVTTAAVDRAGRQVVRVPASGVPRFFRLRQAAGSGGNGVESTSPLDGESGVAVTRETVFRLRSPLAEGVVLAPGDVVAEFAGRRILTRADLSSDRRKITVFYLENLPSASRVQVTLDGQRLEDGDGVALDADGDGQPGGRRVLRFDTFGATALPGTGVEGRVYASEKGPGGVDVPLRNVTITVDGAEETLRTVTDATGFFRLMPAPAGRFFVHVDGRTADGSEWPGGAYYPFVGKAWEAVAGRTNNLAGGSGLIFLPLVPSDALTAVSSTESTRVTPSPQVTAERPELAGLEVVIPPNALFSDSGARGGRVGVAPVPADRLPEPLPPGLRLPLAITVQTDGGQNFDVPVPVRFPNLPDPETGEILPPGARTVLWSFNHDTGRWEPQGMMTISADGRFAEPDPGVGIRQPGWAGVGPGTPGIGPNPPRRPDPTSGGGGGGPGEPEECYEEIRCIFPQPERRWLNCVLKCARDILENPFGGGGSPSRSPIESGLRCIGGPDKCPSNPNDTLTPDQRACMDACQRPEPLIRRYFVPCEGGYIHPCPDDGGAALGLASLKRRPSGLAPEDEPFPDRIEEQFKFWEVEGDYLARLAGTPKFVQVSRADLPRMNAFLAALSDRVQPGSPAGIRLSAEERAALVALPRPSHFSAAEWSAMVDRFDSLQGVPPPPDVAVARARLEALVALLKERGWERRLDGFVDGYTRLSAARAPWRGTDEFPARSHYFMLRDLEAGGEIRGRLTDGGYLPDLVLVPDRVYSIAYLDPVTGRGGAAMFLSERTGALTTIPSAPLEDLEATEPDTDGDGLTDLAEDIVGTEATRPDTDGDGLSDGAEVGNNANPLDGIAEGFGYLAGVSLGQGAREVLVENDVAVVRDESTGLAFVDLKNPLLPVVLGRFRISDPSLSLAVQWPYALVGGQSRATLVDYRNPAAPREVWSREQRGYTVALTFGRAYVAGDLAVAAFDLATGLPVETFELPYGVRHLRALGDGIVAYSQVDFGSLEVLRLSEGGDRVALAGRINYDASCYACGFGLFVEPDFAYISSPRGYEVANFANPAGILRLARQGEFNIGGGVLAKDSGNRLVMATFASTFGLSEVSIFDASDPMVSSNFVAGLGGVSGNIMSFTLYRGRLFAAVEPEGQPTQGALEVFGYRNRDRSTNPPALGLRVFTLRNSPLAEQSLGWFRVSPRASDDVAVRNVEFYVDGTRVQDSGTHPFEVNLQAPELTSSKTNFVVRARAFDTAGNSAWSAPVTIGLVPEIRAPRLLGVTPPEGSVGLTGTVYTVSATFTERLAPASLGTGIQAREAGPDGVFDTADDRSLAVSAVEQPGAVYRLDLGQPLPAGTYRVSVTTNAQDLFGNRLFNPTSWGFLIREPLSWNTGSGSWTTPSGWLPARTPGAVDFVRLPGPAAVQVEIPGAGVATAAYQLDSQATLVFKPGASISLGAESVQRGPTRLGAPGGFAEVSLEGGSLRILGDLEGAGGLQLRDHALVFDAPGRLLRMTDASAALMTYVRGTGSKLVVEPATELELVASPGNIVVWNASDVASGVENRGVLRKRGAGSWRIAGAGVFRNEGTLAVDEGEFAVGAGTLENFATIHIEAGATFRSGRIFPPTRHTRTARVTGSGTNWITGGSIYEGLYDFAGTTVCDGDSKEFRGGVRSPGPWLVSGNGFTVRGLVADFAGPLFLGGEQPSQLARVQVHATGEAIFRDVRLWNAQITGTGRLRVQSSLVVTQQASFASGGAPFLVRFEGPVTLAGRRANNAFLRAADPGLQVSFHRTVDWTSGPLELTTNAIVAAGAQWRVSGDESTEITGSVEAAGLQVRGLYRKEGPGTNRVQRLVNAGGVVEIVGGSVQSLINQQTVGYLQSSGELRLSGGTLDIRWGNASVSEPGTISVTGGAFTGGGEVTGNVTFTGGVLSPGAVSGAGHALLNITGEMNLREGSTLRVTVGDGAPGSGHDQIRATSCEFDGRLEILVAPGFVPATGREFVIATFERRAARQFRQVTGGTLADGRRWDVVYEPKALKLRVLP